MVGIVKEQTDATGDEVDEYFLSNREPMTLLPKICLRQGHV